MNDPVQVLTDRIADFLCHFSKVLPDDVTAKLRQLSQEETAPLAKTIYETMAKNQALAAQLDRPCCQDTGVLQFWVKCGTEFPLINDLEALLKEATLRATFAAPLRHNSVETFDEYNTKRNVGTGTPTVWWDIVPHWDGCEIYTYMAGGGCTLPARAHGADARRRLRRGHGFRTGPDDQLRPQRLSAAAGGRRRGDLH